MIRKKIHIIQTSNFIGIALILIVVFLVVSVDNIHTSWFLPRKGIRQPVWDTLRKMSEYGNLTCMHIEGENLQWNRSGWLHTNATDEEVLKMTESKDGLIKAYAFRILRNRKYADLYPIVLQYIQDTTAFVNKECGCITSTYSLKDFIIADYLSYQYYDQAGNLIQPTTDQKTFLEKQLSREAPVFPTIEVHDPKIQVHRKNKDSREHQTHGNQP